MMEINKKILDLWKRYSKFSEITQYYPLLYPEGGKGQIIFVGLNPSFSESKLIPLGKNQGLFTNEKELEAFFRYSVNDPPQKAVEIQKFDEYAIKEYSVYFNQLYEIAKYVNLELQHTDLFLIRDKEQKNVKKLLDRSPSFFQEQRDLALDVINSLEPRVVVVVNAKASHLILKAWQSITPFSDDTGHHNIILDNGESIPIFFSGMLSGRRPLDKYSRRRLIWHIKISLSE